jgi:hypothetical protein
MARTGNIVDKTELGISTVLMNHNFPDAFDFNVFS